jgi:hypothetical protein
VVIEALVRRGPILPGGVNVQAGSSRYLLQFSYAQFAPSRHRGAKATPRLGSTPHWLASGGPPSRGTPYSSSVQEDCSCGRR